MMEPTKQKARQRGNRWQQHTLPIHAFGIDFA